MNSLNFLDIITILSFYVSLENLEINTKQSERLEQHLSNQGEGLLKKIIKQNEEIIKLLKESKNA